MSIWDFTNAILQNKNNLLTEETDKEYVPYVINKALSFHRDCIFYANEMNMRSHLSKKMQNDFYLKCIKSWKRPFQKWHKFEIDSNIELIKLIYDCSTKKAMEIYPLLDDEKIELLKQKIDKGGLE